MKDPLLLLLLVLVGLFLYFITVKGVIYPVMLFAMIVVTALWYFLNHYISQKMVKKARGEESFFFQKAQMVSPDGTELISGALVITESEVVFCSRKGYMGGVNVIWSAFTSSLLCQGPSHSFVFGLNLNFISFKTRIQLLNCV